MNKLLKQTLVCAGTLLLSMQVVAKPSSEAKEVRGIIDKVNTYWQTHNKPEVRSFWDNAAYHLRQTVFQPPEIGRAHV